MKTKLHFTRHSSRLALLLALLSPLNPQPATLFAQGSAFTYQGLLTSGAVPISGSYDYRFGLFPGAGGGLEIAAQTNSGVLVSNGLFIATFDFGTNAFPGSARWLEISVRSNGVGAFGALSPRQQVTSTPYAIRAATFSGTVSAGQLTGTLSLAQLPGAVVTNNSGAVILTGTFSGNGGGLTNINVTKLGGYTAADFWRLDGNNVNGDFLGSTNNQALQFVVNGVSALRLEPNSMALPNVIGGGGSSVSAGVYAAVIGGGFANGIATNAVEAVIAGGSFNNIGQGSFSSAIGGGANNKIQSNSANATIAGGESNVIETNSSYGVIGGGGQNIHLGNNAYSFIGGGNGNILGFSAGFAVTGGGRNNTNAASASGTIAGGEGNSIQALADRSFIGGGLRNITTGALGMVPGGFANVAGSQAFAAGRRAKANDSGSFVWADSTDADFASSLQNQFNVRASGGYRLYSNAGATIGVQLVSGGNAWAALSDRNMKENFQPIDCRALLEKVVALPVTTWNLKSQPPEIRHIGAMAQDFKASFAVGEDDRHISTSDADGVTLAAIQGLNQKLEDHAKTLESELKQKETEITKLRQRLDALEKIILNPNSN